MILSTNVYTKCIYGKTSANFEKLTFKENLNDSCKAGMIRRSRYDTFHEWKNMRHIYCSFKIFWDFAAIYFDNGNETENYIDNKEENLMIETPLVMVKISHEQRRFTTRQVGAETRPEKRAWLQLNWACCRAGKQMKFDYS